jgi:hypothetical protein
MMYHTGMFGRTKIIISISLLLFAGVGCARMSDFSRETYQKGFLIGDKIEKKEIVVLEMTGGGVAESHLPAAKKIFNRLMQETEPDVRFLSMLSSETGADPSFSIPLTKKVLEESDFAPFQKIASVRYLLQTDLSQVDVTEGATQIQIAGRIWDIEQGDILWEGVGEARGDLFLFVPTAPASFEKAMEVAGRGLIRKLPIGRK